MWLLVAILSSLGLGCVGLSPLLARMHSTEALLNDLIPPWVAGALLGRPSNRASEGGYGKDGSATPSRMTPGSLRHSTDLKVRAQLK